MLEGSCVFVGLQPSVAPGSSFREKRQHLFTIPAHELHKLLKNDGWMIRFDNGIGPDGTYVLTVPSGTLIAMAAVTPTRMLRWSFSGDDRDMQVVKYTLQHLINNFAELKGGTPGYAEFARHLNLQT